MTTTSLVFTEESVGRWVYYEADTFWRLKQMYDARLTAKTWGEFRIMVPKGEFEKLGHWAINGGEQVYWNGGSYLYVDPEELSDFLEESKDHEDYFIICHNKPFDDSRAYKKY